METRETLLRDDSVFYSISSTYQKTIGYHDCECRIYKALTHLSCMEIFKKESIRTRKQWRAQHVETTKLSLRVWTDDSGEHKCPWMARHGNDNYVKGTLYIQNEAPHLISITHVNLITYLQQDIAKKNLNWW